MSENPFQRRRYLVAFAPPLGSSDQVYVSSLQIAEEVLTQDQVVFTHLLVIDALWNQRRSESVIVLLYQRSSQRKCENV